MDPFLVIGILICAVVILGIELATEKIRNYQMRQLADRALVTEQATTKRMREVAKIHQELLSRPVQATIPANFVETIGDMVVRYLDAHSASPIILPPEPPKQ